MKYPQTLFEDFRQNMITGIELGKRLSDFMDSKLQTIAKNIWNHAPFSISLIAIGGYGRRELCPSSDIDLLFLVAEEASDEALKTYIEPFLYTLWDEGLKVGYSVHNIHDICENAKKNYTTLTSLLDTRLIWGQDADLTLLQDRIRGLLNHEEKKAYVHFILDNRIQRHKTYGQTRFVLEPNIKDGKGGMRDYQSLFWICNVLYGAENPDDLMKIGIITKAEAKRFTQCLSYILTIRSHLHDISGRNEERLHFDLQTEVAGRIGYQHRSNAKAVERFMKHYFLVAKDIGNLTRIICAAIEADADMNSDQSRSIFYGFALEKGRITFRDNKQPLNNPRDMIRLFRISQETGYDIHPKALRLISQHKKEITQDIRDDVVANQQFQEILTARVDAAFTLRRMNEAGVLSHFIKEFKHIQALMQFDRYHIYTVDEHTLQAIDILHKIECGELLDDHPLVPRLIHKIENRRALYTAMFLHDIGKGRRRDHSIIGALCAKSLAPRFGISETGSAAVQWLVLHHLAMAITAFRADLQDADTIEQFARFIESEERLNLLTILTTADTMAVGPGRWTSWKAHLIEDLYTKTKTFLDGDTNLPCTPELPDPGILNNEEIRIDFEDSKKQNATKIHITLHENPGIFAKICAGFALVGATILDARIETGTDNITRDNFTIQTTEGHPYDTDKRKDDLKQTLLNVINDIVQTDREIKALPKIQRKKDEVFQIDTLVTISPRSGKPSSIDIVTRDKPGLLYHIAQILEQNRLTICSAKIITQGLKAEDVFYVQPQIRDEYNTPEQWQALKETLEQSLTSSHSKTLI